MIEAMMVVFFIVLGFAVTVGLCFIGVCLWIAVLEEMKWAPGDPLDHLADRIIRFGRRVIRKLKRRGDGRAA